MVAPCSAEDSVPPGDSVDLGPWSLGSPGSLDQEPVTAVAWAVIASRR